MADNLFWLGRYTERVEAAVRITRAILARFFQEEDAARTAGLNAGLEILSALGYLPEARSPPPPEHEVLAMIYDPAAPNGLVWNIHQVRRVAWLLRDRISVDAWLILNQLDQQFSISRPPSEFRVSAAQDRLNHAIITLSAFCGMVMESMTRGDGWRFLDIGRRLERAIQMTELAAQRPAPRSFRRRRRAGSDSGNGRQLHHLSLALSDVAANGPGAGSAAGGRSQSALHRFSTGAPAASTSDELPGSQTSIRRPAEERGRRCRC